MRGKYVISFQGDNYDYFYENTREIIIFDWDLTTSVN